MGPEGFYPCITSAMLPATGTRCRRESDRNIAKKIGTPLFFSLACIMHLVALEKRIFTLASSGTSNPSNNNSIMIPGCYAGRGPSWPESRCRILEGSWLCRCLLGTQYFFFKLWLVIVKHATHRFMSNLNKNLHHNPSFTCNSPEAYIATLASWQVGCSLRCF